MSCPAQLIFPYDSLDAWHLGAFKDFGVRNMVLPLDVKELPQTVQMESIEHFLMSCIDGPRFTGVE